MAYEKEWRRRPQRRAASAPCRCSPCHISTAVIVGRVNQAVCGRATAGCVASLHLRRSSLPGSAPRQLFASALLRLRRSLRCGKNKVPPRLTHGVYTEFFGAVKNGACVFHPCGRGSLRLQTSWLGGQSCGAVNQLGLAATHPSAARGLQEHTDRSAFVGSTFAGRGAGPPGLASPKKRPPCLTFRFRTGT